MAEGGQDEDSGDVMLAGAAAAAQATTTTTTLSSGGGGGPMSATPKRERDQESAQQPIALNIKSEVCTLTCLFYNILNSNTLELRS